MPELPPQIDGVLSEIQAQAVAIMLSEKKSEAKHGGTYIDTDEQPQRLAKPTRSKR